MKTNTLPPPNSPDDPLDKAIFMAFADYSLEGDERRALARALVNPGFVARCLLALEREEARGKEASP